MVAVGFWGKTGTIFGGNEVSELRWKSLKGTVFTGKLENVNFLVVSAGRDKLSSRKHTSDMARKFN